MINFVKITIIFEIYLVVYSNAINFLFILVSIS